MGSHASAGASRAVVDSIRRIVRALRGSSREAERRVGISGAQLFVLQQLASGPAGSLAEVAQRTLTHPSSVSVVVSRLAAAGLLVRAPSQLDRRRTELRLTARGRRLLRSAPALAQEGLIEAVVRLPRGRRAQLAGGLAALIEEMRLGGAAAPMFFEEGRARRRRANARR